MLDNIYISNVCTIVGKEDFYDPRHGIVFEAIANLHDKSIPVDLLTVADHLQTTSYLEKIGGRVKLTEHTEDVYSAANCERYAEIIKGHSVKRQLTRIGLDINSKAQNHNGDAKEILGFAEKQILSISINRGGNEIKGVTELLVPALKNIETAASAEGGIAGTPTGLVDLDVATAGLHNSDLTILAGRPGMGKTALALRIIENVAMALGKPSALISLEMTAEQLVQRLLCSVGKVNSHRLRSGSLRDYEYINLNEAASKIDGAPIFIDDPPDLTIWELRSKARMLKAQRNIGLLVIDYLQLMTAGYKIENRQQDISAISRACKSLAKELKIPVIALSQLSRQVELRGGTKIPQLADLRESGAIEQDADNVIFVYRPGGYAKTKEDWVKLKAENKHNHAELIIAKQRSGPTCSVDVIYKSAYTRFENKETKRPEIPGNQQLNF